MSVSVFQSVGISKQHAQATANPDGQHAARFHVTAERAALATRENLRNMIQVRGAIRGVFFDRRVMIRIDLGQKRR